MKNDLNKKQRLHVRALRVQKLLQVLLKKKPSLAAIKDYLDPDSESIVFALQEWVGGLSDAVGIDWMQNVGILDGIIVMADNPVEGETLETDPAFSYIVGIVGKEAALSHSYY